jgi:hypothetical protein
VGQGGLTLGQRGQGPGRAPYVWAYPLAPLDLLASWVFW